MGLFPMNVGGGGTLEADSLAQIVSSTINANLGDYYFVILFGNNRYTAPTISGVQAIQPLQYVMGTAAGDYTYIGIFRAISNQISFSGTYKSGDYYSVRT